MLPSKFQIDLGAKTLIKTTLCRTTLNRLTRRGAFFILPARFLQVSADCHSAECHSAECRGAIFCASTPVETKKQKLEEMTTNLELKTSIFIETDPEMCFNPSLTFRQGQTLADRTSVGPSFQL
jgi:hypothetical protein